MRTSAPPLLHSIHPFPCKFPPETVTDFLPGDGMVLDPFCGSGTTLLEASSRGLPSVGIDCNPIAVRISKAKLANLSSRHEELLLGLASAADACSDVPSLDFPGSDHWFTPMARHDLARISHAINAAALPPWPKTVAEVALSSVVNRASLQDSDTRYARVDRAYRPGSAITEFASKVATAISAIRERGPLRGVRRVILGDATRRIPLRDGSVAAIITSPPYANSMDYYLYHKQRMNILGLDFKRAQATEIGSRHEYSSLRAGVDKWRKDTHAWVAEAARVLRKDGYAIVVIGDSKVQGEHVSGAEIIEHAAASHGMRFELLSSEALSERRGSFNKAFQRAGKLEHVVRLRRIR